MNNQRNFGNNLLNRFNSYTNNNNPYQNNPLLNNNPNLNMKDSSFFNKMNMAKLEQIKRARNIDEMGIDKKQLTDLIICPIAINKVNKNELNEAYNEIVPHYDTKINKIVNEWWQTRTNQPYKNIIKKDLFNKDFKKYYNDNIFNTNIKDKKELLVHKVTSEDWDKILLEAEYEILNDILEKHDKELKVIYSSSKKNQYKKEFEYVQNYRYRLEYNPKNSEELKDFYKKEQKKINKESKMIDDVINTLIENDELTNDEINKINSEIKTYNKKSSKIDRLEDELRKELGDDYEDIINNIDINELNESDSDDNIKSKSKSKSKSKLKSKKNNREESEESEEKKSDRKMIKVTTIKDKDDIKSEDDTKPKKKITVKTIKSQEKNDEINEEKINEIKEKYKNRK
jgi:hypothetical protein